MRALLAAAPTHRVQQLHVLLPELHSQDSRKGVHHVVDFDGGDCARDGTSSPMRSKNKLRSCNCSYQSPSGRLRMSQGRKAQQLAETRLQTRNKSKPTGTRAARDERTM